MRGFLRLGFTIVVLTAVNAQCPAEDEAAPKKTLAERMGLPSKANPPAKIVKELEPIEPPRDTAWYPRSLGEIKGVLATLALPGNHKDKKQLFLNRMKAYRFICEVAYEDLSWSSELEECVRLAIEAFHMNNEASHGPKKPEKMGEEDFKKARHGAGGNLFGGLTHPTACVDGWMYDSAFGEFNAVGHRRWCINPAMRQTAFAEKWPYAVMQFDGSRNPVPDWEYVAFPARGYMPMELNYMGGATAWSVSLNMSKYESPKKELVKVTVQPVNEKLEDVGEPYPLDCLTIDHNGFGSGPAIVFRPEGGFGPIGFKMKHDVRIRVTIDGIQGRSPKQPARIQYLVHFIDMKTVPHTPESRRIITASLRKQLDVIKETYDATDKWEALTSFAAAEVLKAADVSLATEAKDEIAELLKDPVVRKEHEAVERFKVITELEDIARKDQGKTSRHEKLVAVAANYRDHSFFFKDTRVGKRAAESFERLKKDLFK